MQTPAERESDSSYDLPSNSPAHCYLNSIQSHPVDVDNAIDIVNVHVTPAHAHAHVSVDMPVNHYDSSLPIVRTHLFVRHRSLFEYLFPTCTQTSRRLKHVFHNPLTASIRSLSFALSACMSILVFARMLDDVYTCVFAFILNVPPHIYGLLMCNSSLLYHLFFSSFEVWLLLSQICLVYISCIYIFNSDHRMLIVYGWCLSLMHVVVFDASPIPPIRKTIAVAFALSANVCWPLLVYFKITSPDTHTMSVLGRSIDAEDMFVSHMFTCCALLCRHLYMSIRHPGASVVLNSNFKLAM
jgi:hypothetical protein